MRKRFLLVFLLPFYGAFAQDISSYLLPPYPTNLVSSTDGQTFAWVFNEKGSRNIYMAAHDGSNVKKLTNYSGDDGMDITELQLTATGDRIIFVRGNPANSRGEAANPALLQQATERVIYLIAAKGGAPQRIAAGNEPRISPNGTQLAYISGGQVWLASLSDTTVKPHKLFQSRGSQRHLRWAPGGDAIAFVSDRGDHSFVGIYEFTKKQVQFVDASVDKDLSPAWSSDGKKLAYLRIPNRHNSLPFIPVQTANPWSIRIYHRDLNRAEEAWRAAPGTGSAFFADLPVADNQLWWTPGGKLVFPYEGDGWVHLYALDENSKTPRILTPGKGEVENVTQAANGNILYYTSNINDINRRHIWQVDVATGKTSQLTTGELIEWSPVATAGGIAFLHSSATRPAWPAVLHGGRKADVAPELFPASFPSNLVQPTAITLTASDGFKSYGQLFLPPDYASNKKYPAIVYLHGGSRRQMLLGFHYSQYYSNAYALNQYLASKGYIVLSLNFRSGIGYGMHFREAPHYGASGASEVKDLLAAGYYLQKRPDVKAARIGLYGASYGGYLTAHGLAQAPNLFSAGVDIHGVHDWNNGIPVFAPWYDKARFPEMARKAHESSPVFHLKNWKAPVLLIHGDDDRNVLFSESVIVAESLRKQGVVVEQLVLPDEVHSFLLYSSWEKVLNATFGFLDRHLSKELKQK